MASQPPRLLDVSSLAATANDALDIGLIDTLCAGLPAGSQSRVEQALHAATELYAGATLGTGELYLDHAVGMARTCAVLNLDLDARLAALLFGAAALAEAEMEPAGDWQERVIGSFGTAVAKIIEGLHRLNMLRLITRDQRKRGTPEAREQSETLRKMLLAMVEDIRVVLLRLASRNQTLRYMTAHPGLVREQLAHESLEIFAPLANRLGVWQIKWELEDLSFRFLEAETYKRIARMLDERRSEREQFIETTMLRLKAELATAGIQAEVQGRPKHIYSIWNKMRAKRLEFDEVYDVRALRILVAEIKDCYAALSIVHGRWQPVPGEFDDYIAQPKGNNYQSLHTAVIAEDGRPFEVQIRTYEMHYHSELGVAAHWRYKESGHSNESSDTAYDDKIAWLRQLLSWRDEIADSSEWVAHFKRAELDDTIYVMTPQGRVFDLAQGATPLDFAYRLHTDLGHRCRGARVDGQLVSLNTPLANGQRVDIVAAKQGGPSRDWLNPALGFLATHRARQKVRQWFAAQEDELLLGQGRALIARELQREGQTQANIDGLAVKLGYKNADELYRAAGRNEVGARLLQSALRGDADEKLDAPPEIQTRTSRVPRAGSNEGVLVVGVDKLLTQLARCCRPVPPDPIAGFVTRGKGVSIHRTDCRTFKAIVARQPERVIDTTWGAESASKGLYSVNVVVDALDRQGLLRDISEVLSREHVNVTAVKTLSRSGKARMAFTVELGSVTQLQRLLNLVREVTGVIDARRG
ncbi:MAG: bifunctional (p)ppGpp synthetase/guanosine-3',5'-bis(diphosphate) 3'-pyrophosphohydrolase [Sterolibacterium sp.]|nr:bifunctional (p)ppGpp synthetase/guanosine-3',5'-bis(diphosphate) 3'-pyrophosphohydrolase [Sterolibacterium sp.]